MFYSIALAGAHKRVVEQLREQLVMVRFNSIYFCTPEVFLVASIIRHTEEEHSSHTSACLVFGGSEECFIDYIGKVTEAQKYFSV